MTPQLMTILVYAIAVPVALLQRLLPAVELSFQYLLFLLTHDLSDVQTFVSPPVLQAVPALLDTAQPITVETKPKRATRRKKVAVTA